jgi:hypothetical protein
MAAKTKAATPTDFRFLLTGRLRRLFAAVRIYPQQSPFRCKTNCKTVAYVITEIIVISMCYIGSAPEAVSATPNMSNDATA